LEFAGNNVEKAAAIASKKLDIPRDKLRYQVLSYGSTGIFGLVGTKKAKIKVILPVEATDTAGEETAAVPGKPTDEAPERAGTVGDEPGEIPPMAAAEGRDVPAGKGEEPIGLGYDLLERITQLIAGDAKIAVDDNGDRLLYKIESRNAAVLIGKRGQTLEAIQFLAEKVINRHSAERMHVQVDVEGYLEKRQASLESLASRMAEKAVRTKKPVTIGQMSAYERRIVHLALKEDSRVRTQSKGDGFLRKLVIFPIRDSKNKENGPIL